MLSKPVLFFWWSVGAQEIHNLERILQNSFVVEINDTL